MPIVERATRNRWCIVKLAACVAVLAMLNVQWLVTVGFRAHFATQIGHQDEERPSTFRHGAEILKRHQANRNTIGEKTIDGVLPSSKQDDTILTAVASGKQDDTALTSSLKSSKLIDSVPGRNWNVNNTRNSEETWETTANETIDSSSRSQTGRKEEKLYSSRSQTGRKEEKLHRSQTGRKEEKLHSNNNDGFSTILSRHVPSTFKVYVYKTDPFLNWLRLFELGYCVNPIATRRKVISGSRKSQQEKAPVDENLLPHSVLDWWSRYWHSDDLHFARAVTSLEFEQSKWYTNDPAEASVFAVPLLMNLFVAPPTGYEKVSCNITFDEIVHRTQIALHKHAHYEQTTTKHFYSMGHFHFRNPLAIPPSLRMELSQSIGATFENTVSAFRCAVPSLYIPYPCAHESEATLVGEWFKQPKLKSVPLPSVNMKNWNTVWSDGNECFENNNCTMWFESRIIDVGFRGRIDTRNAYTNRKRYCSHMTLLSNRKKIATCISTAPLWFRPPIRIRHKVSVYEGVECNQHRYQECTAVDASYKLRYCSEMLSSKFSSFLRGDTLSSNRLVEALQAGSFPILIVNETESIHPYTKVQIRGVPWDNIWMTCRLGSGFDKCMTDILEQEPKQLASRYKLMREFAHILDYWWHNGIPASLFQMYQAATNCETPMKWNHPQSRLEPQF